MTFILTVQPPEEEGYYIHPACASEPKSECFFQVLAFHDVESDHLKTQSIIHFSQNYANISGSTLYGGLLDRCAVCQFAEVQHKCKPGQNYEYKGPILKIFQLVRTP